ncbi:hypothetical protein ABTZ58_38670 [Streptomyces sp. NPDC094143]|uniref:hypothetical protein n=1 Tax=Streptomyces sp. NPDC094143 TaxID=3155310 RepID=UPI00332CF9A8
MDASTGSGIVVCGRIGTMIAAYVEEFGSPDVIRYGELPTPRPGPDRLYRLPAGVPAADVVAVAIRPRRRTWGCSRTAVCGSARRWSSWERAGTWAAPRC